MLVLGRTRDSVVIGVSIVASARKILLSTLPLGACYASANV